MSCHFISYKHWLNNRKPQKVTTVYKKNHFELVVYLKWYKNNRLHYKFQLFIIILKWLTNHWHWYCPLGQYEDPYNSVTLRSQLSDYCKNLTVHDNWHKQSSSVLAVHLKQQQFPFPPWLSFFVTRATVKNACEPFKTIYLNNVRRKETTLTYEFESEKSRQ